ncbi:hypothetical protein HER32_11845 [Hymenobacter sp. BT18]|uniref:hypothetical protein n=1 Tax=Hymenobacter sp. BT18 TaxID=2835648 RepID=UPI00143E40BB|nr:hypothetical protein [Hymenobacter sp. BT18]QIX61834.1 hypothetical protein HER32_11845 [Hymenobacter sp. BT18]
MASESTPAPRTTKAVTAKPVVANLKAPSSSINVAQELARFIKEKNLCSNIKGKDYVQVEGWQFAGSQLGIVPIMGAVEDLSFEKELRFRATVSLYDLHNKINLGGGVAECSNTETTKRYYERYAICSMAQTRAVGKAYRNVLAWLIKAAGFEATPYEEMVDVVDAGTGATVVEEKPRPAGGPGHEKDAAPSDEDAPAQPSEAQRKQLIALIASPLLDDEERSTLLAVPVDSRPLDWMEKTLAKLPAVLKERENPKKALAAAQNQLRQVATKYAAQLGEQEHKRWMLRADSLTAKPEELRAESRALVAHFTLQPA